MKVTLLYPEVYDMARFRERRKEFPPFGVLYLAASLRELGHDVRVRKVTKNDRPLDLTGQDAVGWSLASSATYGIMLSARRTAQLDPETLVMVGGVHANFYPEESLVDFDADVVSCGESDVTIGGLVSEARRRRFEDIPGLIWRTSAGEIQRTAPAPLMKDISDLPLPARDLLDRDDIVMSDRLAGRDVRMAHVMFSRGCPFPCTFCAAGQTRLQYRSGASARMELEVLIREYGIEGFSIVDDNFVVNKARVRDICSSIAPLHLAWSALSRVDTVDGSLLKDMADAGCIEVKFGVESGSEKLLKAMRKNTSRAQIVSAIRQARAAGIEPKAFIIHGYPGENLATTQETMSLLDELTEDLVRVSLFRFVPLPGTAIYDGSLPSPRVHGTHLAADWDGDWEKFHIHHNHKHWWGDEGDFEELQVAYARLESYVEQQWGPQS